MAHIFIPEQNRKIQEPNEISSFLAGFGVKYERWSTDAVLGDDPTNDQILSAYGPQVEALKKKGGYVAADVVNVTSQTPNLQAMLDKFNKEHTHDDDEIRFIVKGRGIFHIHPPQGPVFAIETAAGDLIVVPAGTMHWFDLCEDRNIRAIRLFRDPAGWTPRYIANGVHENYTPVCWGPAYIPANLPKISTVLQS
jgi:1,2-dihydroxy-3-keto-5-methylthiopentene dioxygenase